MNLIKTSLQASLQILDSRRRWKWLVLLVLAFAMAALEAVGAALVYTLVSIVSGPDAAATLPFIGDLKDRFPNAELRNLQLWAAVSVAAFFVVRGVALTGQEYIRARVIQNAGAQVAQRLVEGYLRLPYLEHTRRNSAEFVRNGFDSAQRFVFNVVTPLITLAAEGVLVIALMLVLIFVSPVATVAAVAAFLPAIMLLQYKIQPLIKRLGRRSQNSRAASIKALQQGLGGIREIRLLGREAFFAKRFRDPRAELARSEYLNVTLQTLPRTLIETVLILAIVAIFMAAILAGQAPGQTFAMLGVFAYVGLRIQPSLQKLVAALNQLRFGSAIIDDLLADLTMIDSAPIEAASVDAVSSNSSRPLLELKNVTFRYTQDAEPALTSVSLSIDEGSFIGICGPTGGGKSTLIDLMIGLLPPDEGQLFIDGQDLNGREAKWQHDLGVVSQNVFLIDDTLRANIAFGIEQRDWDHEALQRAVERAQLSDVVRTLPQGLDTEVGERGIRLSGGQRQRVAIARALYLEPRVIVFDEGTSALDTATEASLVQALDDLRTRRTLISVAHRISTVREADRIYIVDQGRIVAGGKYSKLLAENPLFQRLAH